MDSHRHEIWGDNPEERDADAVVADVASDRRIQRKWHEHPSVAPLRVVALFIQRNAKRLAVTIVGAAVVIVGLILVPLPGPGWLIVFGGLAILATEYVWAQRLLNYSKRKVGRAKDAVLRKNTVEGPTQGEPDRGGPS